MTGFNELILMLRLVLNSLPALGLGIALASILYLLFSLCCVALFGQRRRASSLYLPPITVLKPIHGLDSHLYENLRSFCLQDYPRYQVIFAVAHDTDPAIEIVRKIVADLPERDLALVVDDRRIGTNNKISNIANAYRQAKHDILVIADSDMRVGADYLTQVAAAFDDAGVGAVTCLYTGTAAGGLASRLGSMFINESFLPSVLVALRLQVLRFCFGATMAVRRQALEDIGGFAALSSFLADDYMLGKLVSDKGYTVLLAPYVVENMVYESDLKAMLWHELRWGRTIRTVRPAGYTFSFLTQPVAVSALLLVLSHSLYPGLYLLCTAMTLRVTLHYVVRGCLHIPGRATPWLVPLRDLLSFAVWAASFLGRDVRWRDRLFVVQHDGQMTAIRGQSA